MNISIFSIDQEGNNRETRQMCCISERILEHACKHPGVLKEDISSLTSGSGVQASGTPTRTFSCPDRKSPPPPPTSQPYTTTEKSREKLKVWMGKCYTSSAFNKCQHQQLPLMTHLPPLELIWQGEIEGSQECCWTTTLGPCAMPEQSCHLRYQDSPQRRR